MSFEKQKAINNIVEDLERDDLVEHTLHLGSIIMTGTKEEENYQLIVDCHGLNKQI